MKKLTTTLYLVCLLVVQVTISNAQFTAASVTSNAAGSSIAVSRQTGNDIYFDGSNYYEVTVWEDVTNYASIQFIYNGTATSITYLSTDYCLDPDVVLVQKSGGGVYAIVAMYNVTKSEFQMVVYECAPGGPSLNYESTTVLGSGTFSGSNVAINIDGDEDGNFVIIWNESTSYYLYAVTGDHAGSTVSLNYSGTPVNVGTNQIGFYPDVCVYGGGTDVIHYSYIYPGNDELYIESDDFYELSIGNPGNASTIYTEIPDYTWHNPRIACPYSSSGTSNDWTVVAEDWDNTAQYKIKGITNNNSSIGNYELNTGANITPDLSYEVNELPVVAYSKQYPYVISVGWTLDDSNGNIYIAAPNPGKPTPTAGVQPIVVLLDENGSMLVNEYWEVCEFIGNGESANILSLSGRYSDDDLYLTYWHYDNSSTYDIYSKIVSSIPTASNLKLQQNGTNSQNIDPDEMAKLVIVDLAGRILLNVEGNYSDVIYKLINFKKQASNNIFISQLSLLKSGNIITNKFTGDNIN